MGFRVTTGTHRPAGVGFLFDGRRIPAHPGETIAAALLAEGVGVFRRDSCGTPRGPYCNMGTCFECLVEVCLPRDAGTERAHEGGWLRVRACLTAVSAGLEVRSVSAHRQVE